MSKLTVDQALAQALAHHNAGRLQDAENLYRQILQVAPGHSDALHLLGLLAHQVNRNDVAAQLVSQAVAANPNVPNYLNTLGEIQRLSNHLDDALRAFDRAIALDPNYTPAISNRALVLQAQNQHDLAIASLTAMLQRHPNSADAWNNLGTSYRATAKLPEAVAAYRQALRVNPNHVPALNNISVALHDLDENQQSVTFASQAAQLAPNLPDTHHNLGLAQIQLNLVADAIASWQRATALRPDFADAHFNLALALLLTGDYTHGWAEHEYRWLCRDLPKARPFTQPQYDGSPLAGRTLLLHAEQGFGDTFQFVRFIAQLAPLTSSGRVILEAQPELLDLLRRSPSLTPIADFIPTGAALPPFDTHLPLMSQPFVLRTTLETLPSQVPYLIPDPAKVAAWQTRLNAAANPTAPFRVGLVWAGRPDPTNRHRSMDPAFLQTLSQVPGVTFVSLQKGPAAATPPFPMLDFTADLHSFDDTAALLANLDLLITIDTALAHLSGAMAKPTWTLLRFVLDWRWLKDRSDSPWYPTMRLFRQSAPHAWPQVIAQVAAELQQASMKHAKK